MNLIVILVIASVFVVKCEHLILGDPSSTILIHHTFAKYNAIPFTKRIKSEFFSSKNSEVITRILAYDNLHSKAEATVTAGGIGFTYVNLRLKSEQGMGLDYDIGIYS